MGRGEVVGKLFSTEVFEDMLDKWAFASLTEDR